MEQRPSSKANSCWANQEIFSLWWNSNFDYYVHRSPTCGRWTPSTHSHPISFRFILISSSHLGLDRLSCLFPSIVPPFLIQNPGFMLNDTSSGNVPVTYSNNFSEFAESVSLVSARNTILPFPPTMSVRTYQHLDVATFVSVTAVSTECNDSNPRLALAKDNNGTASCKIHLQMQMAHTETQAYIHNLALMFIMRNSQNPTPFYFKPRNRLHLILSAKLVFTTELSSNFSYLNFAYTRLIVHTCYILCPHNPPWQGAQIITPLSM